MDPLEAIRRVQANRLIGEDGDEVDLELAPALPPADPDRLADESAFRCRESFVRSSSVRQGWTVRCRD
jgi:hypothetical protein